MDHRTTKVFLVDDHPLVLEWLTNLIDQQTDMVVCGGAATVAEAFDGIVAKGPDVAIVDISLKDGSGIELIKKISSDHLPVSVIVLSMYDENLYAARALRAGARGYITKRETAQKVVEAIRQVLKGNLYLSEQTKLLLAKRFVEGKTMEPGVTVERLSDRELEVFQLLGEGYETRQIAERLHVSMKTVQAFFARIKEKLNLATATELLREAILWHENERSK